jgi:hypothetical protein
MPGPKPAAIELSKAEWAELEQLTKAHRTAQQIALRSRIILAADAGQNNAEIARGLEVALNTVRLWRERWLRLAAIPLDELSVAERLEDLPRPGAPAGISADQQCQIEIWFSILVRKLLRRGNFVCLEHLRTKVLAFIQYYNQTMARPFKWAYQGRALAA